MPAFNVVVDFSNGGRLSEFIVAKGGTAARIALAAPRLEITLLEGPQEEIMSVAFSPDGKWIAMGTDGEPGNSLGDKHRLDPLERERPREQRGV